MFNINAIKDDYDRYYINVIYFYISQKRKISLLIQAEYENVRPTRLRPTLISEENKVIVEEVSEEEANGIERVNINSYPSEEGVELNEDNAVDVIAPSENTIQKSISEISSKKKKVKSNNLSMVEYNETQSSQLVSIKDKSYSSTLSLVRYKKKIPQPDWHAPWELMRVISGHLGWVRCIAIDHTNEWFATGGNDRTIKVYYILYYIYRYGILQLEH